MKNFNFAAFICFIVIFNASLYLISYLIEDKTWAMWTMGTVLYVYGSIMEPLMDWK